MAHASSNGVIGFSKDCTILIRGVGIRCFRLINAEDNTYFFFFETYAVGVQSFPTDSVSTIVEWELNEKLIREYFDKSYLNIADNVRPVEVEQVGG